MPAYAVNGGRRGQERMALDYSAHTALTKFAPRADLLAAIKSIF